ncbi:hypothetical protein N7453_011213 [Penicillium expansum]|nr:hypothetical protein N7453_011213 [Penicillium expansum]
MPTPLFTADNEEKRKKKREGIVRNVTPQARGPYFAQPTERRQQEYVQLQAFPKNTRRMSLNRPNLFLPQSPNPRTLYATAIGRRPVLMEAKRTRQPQIAAPPPRFPPSSVYTITQTPLGYDPEAVLKQYNTAICKDITVIAREFSAERTHAKPSHGTGSGRTEV